LKVALIGKIAINVLLALDSSFMEK